MAVPVKSERIRRRRTATSQTYVREELTQNPSLGKKSLTNDQRNKADATKAYGDGRGNQKMMIR